MLKKGQYYAASCRNIANLTSLDEKKNLQRKEEMMSFNDCTMYVRT
jgi:hypothetical protein